MGEKKGSVLKKGERYQQLTHKMNSLNTTNALD